METIVKQSMHFAPKQIIQPVHPVSVNLIGAGGTGSRVLTALAEMNATLIALGHPGFSVTLYDDDLVSETNLIRQRFAASELGLPKSLCRINNINRWFGTDWKAVTHYFNRENLWRFADNGSAQLFISCVDTVAARYELEKILVMLRSSLDCEARPLYWMDYGNGKDSGQVILSTVGNLAQPKSENYQTVGNLPFVTEEFAELLAEGDTADSGPSCSAAEALDKQDLFINSALAQLGSALLYRLFRQLMTPYRGFFLNLDTMRSQPVEVA